MSISHIKKIDREERPDLDHIYMSRAGDHRQWRLAFMYFSRRKAAFFGGTYFPPRAILTGLPGGTLKAIKDSFHDKRGEIEQQHKVLPAIRATTGSFGAWQWRRPPGPEIS